MLEKAVSLTRDRGSIVHDSLNLHLLVALVRRDFKVQYRRSLIGPVWAILYSVTYLSLFFVIRSLLGIPSDGKPYILFTAVAIVPWTFFSGAVVRAGASILLNASIIKKMAVRREVFPASAVVLSLVDFCVSSVVVVVLALWFGLSIGWSVVFLPLFIALLAACAFGVGMIVASLGVYRRDVVFALPFLIQVWMLLSPIMYPLSLVPERWRLLYALNPMVGILEGFRSILLDGAAPDLQLTALSFVGTMIILLSGWSLFRVLSQHFVDVM